VRHKGDTLTQVLGSNPPNMTFRRTLFGPRLVNWGALFLRLTNIQLTYGKDIFQWILHENGKFSVAFMYNALILPDVPVYDNKKIWKMKIPLKNKIFAWYLRRGVILTKDNFIKHNWHGNKTCFFHKMRQLNICFSNATLLVLYGQSSRQILACILLLVSPISLGIG
jgi:hypothetical protein